ncbi:hypothetical protein Tco_1286091 [Tanacetum coccineum]
MNNRMMMKVDQKFNMELSICATASGNRSNELILRSVINIKLVQIDFVEKKEDVWLLRAPDIVINTKTVFIEIQLNAGRPRINSVRPNINSGRTNVNSVRPRVSIDHPSPRLWGQKRNKGIKQEYSNARTHTANGVVKIEQDPNEAARTMYQTHFYQLLFRHEALILLAISLIGKVTKQLQSTLQSPNANASEEADEDEELIVVPTTIKHSAAKVGPRKSSTNSKEEKFLTELQNLQTQEKEAFSTGISEDTPEILAFRRDLDQPA